MNKTEQQHELAEIDQEMAVSYFNYKWKIELFLYCKEFW